MATGVKRTKKRIFTQTEIETLVGRWRTRKNKTKQKHLVATAADHQQEEAERVATSVMQVTLEM